MKVGDLVEITHCNQCPDMEGKTAQIERTTECFVKLRFGKGRPQVNRPVMYRKCDVRLVN